MNSDLSWNDHIAHVLTQVSKACGTLYSISTPSTIIPGKVLRQVFISLVQPYLMYCIPLWGAVFHNTLLQKKCVRIISRKTKKINNKFQNTKPMFFRLKLLTTFNLYTY
jgi:hypothetical protein